jgi:hypothetical protein
MAVIFIDLDANVLALLMWVVLVNDNKVFILSHIQEALVCIK